MSLSVLPCCPHDEQEGALAPIPMHKSHIPHMVSSVSEIRMTGNKGSLTVCVLRCAGALCCRWSSAPGS